jgi:hypothetical protein
MLSKVSPPITERKKMLVVCQHYWPESFRINDICEYFIEKGYDIDVLCGLPNYPSGKFMDGYGYFKNRRQTHNGVNIERAFEIPRGNNSNFRIFINYISFPISSLFHIPRLLTRKYDKIFVFTYSPVMMAIAGILVGRIKKVETTMTVLDLWPENLFSVLDLKNKFLRNLVTRISHWHYKQVDKMIVPSLTMGKKVQSISNLPKNKIIALPQACEKLYETDIHDDILVKKFNKGFNILFTGNISPAQSFNTIVDAAKQIKMDGISDINWIIVGSGMSKRWLEEEVIKAGLNECFYFEGQKPIEDIPRYTTLADALIGCLVKSDLLEASIPAKVTSYLAAGRPMVMALDGEAQDIINNKAKCGFASPTEDVHALVKNIKKLYNMSSVERDKMGKRGRDYHFKNLERNLIMKKMENFIFNN